MQRETGDDFTFTYESSISPYFVAAVGKRTAESGVRRIMRELPFVCRAPVAVDLAVTGAAVVPIAVGADRAAKWFAVLAP